MTAAQYSDLSLTLPISHIPIGEIHDDSASPPRDPGSMAGWIADHGLLEPLAVRPENKGYIVIAGRRRLSAIRLLIIIDMAVYDPETGTQRPASEVYASVQCRVLPGLPDPLLAMMGR